MSPDPREVLPARWYANDVHSSSGDRPGVRRPWEISVEIAALFSAFCA